MLGSPPTEIVVAPSLVETLIPVKHDNSFICLLDYVSYLIDIASFFVESHILVLGDKFEGLSLLFDDSHNTTIVPSCLSLELVEN